MYALPHEVIAPIDMLRPLMISRMIRKYLARLVIFFDNFRLNNRKSELFEHHALLLHILYFSRKPHIFRFYCRQYNRLLGLALPRYRATRQKVDVACNRSSVVERVSDIGVHASGVVQLLQSCRLPRRLR